MTAVTLYRIESHDVTIQSGYQLWAPEEDEFRYLVREEKYELPAGYTLAETRMGEPAIYDDRDQYCDVVMHSSGRPQLISGRPEMPVLHQVAAHA